MGGIPRRLGAWWGGGHRGGRKVLGNLLGASWPPGGCGSLLGGLHDKGRNPGWPPGAWRGGRLGSWWASWGLWEPLGRRDLGGSCGESWVASWGPPGSLLQPSSKTPQGHGPNNSWSAKVYQACRTLPQSSREPSEQTSTQAQAIILRLLQPGNAEARSVRPNKGQT